MLAPSCTLRPMQMREQTFLLTFEVTITIGKVPYQKYGRELGMHDDKILTQNVYFLTRKFELVTRITKSIYFTRNCSSY